MLQWKALSRISLLKTISCTILLLLCLFTSLGISHLYIPISTHTYATVQDQAPCAPVHHWYRRAVYHSHEKPVMVVGASMKMCIEIATAAYPILPIPFSPLENPVFPLRI